MRRVVFSILAVFATVAFARSQDVIPYPTYLDLMSLASKSAVYLESGEWAGTGLVFTIPFSDTSHQGMACILTAKHILAIGVSDTATKYYPYADVYLNIKGGGKEKRRYIIGVFSKKHDLVVLIPAEWKRHWSQYDVADSAFTPTFFADPESTEVGQSVIVAGFPVSTDVRASKLHPVVQTGIVAQVPGGDTTLIDIHVNHGNSGGGAFTITRDGHLKILGLVFAFRLTQQLAITEIVRDTKGNLLDLKTEGTNSALGVVTSVKRLRPVLNQLLDFKGIVVID